jgi:hypothetical protein
MQTTPAPPWLPGVRATTPFLINALVFWAFLLLLASFLVAAVVITRAIPLPPCGIGGCAPTYPMIPLVLPSQFVIMGFSFYAQYRWLRGVEASSGVWLRYRNSGSRRSGYRDEML